MMRALLISLILVAASLLLPARATAQPSGLDDFLSGVHQAGIENAAQGLGARLISDAYKAHKDKLVAKIPKPIVDGAKQLLSSASRSKAIMLAGKFVKRLSVDVVVGVISEIPEVVAAFKEDGWRGAAINVLGGAANVLVAWLLDKPTTGLRLSPLQAFACRDIARRNSPTATHSIGFCNGDFLADYLVAAGGEASERLVEAGLQKLFGGPGQDRGGSPGQGTGRNGGSGAGGAGGGRPKGTSDWGAGGGGRTRVDAVVDQVNTNATGSSTAVADIGVARVGGETVNARADDVTTTARGQASAYSGIGVAEGRGSEVNVRVDDVTTTARDRATAESLVGIAKNGADVTASVREDVTTTASGSGRASSIVGRSSGGNVTAQVGGSVTTNANRGSSSTRIGDGASAFVRGDVVTRNGDTSVGGACVARRNGACCVQVHRNLCVLNVLPPDNKGRCPPRFERSGGLCYLYSDKEHRIER